MAYKVLPDLASCYLCDFILCPSLFHLIPLSHSGLLAVLRTLEAHCTSGPLCLLYSSWNTVPPDTLMFHAIA